MCIRDRSNRIDKETTENAQVNDVCRIHGLSNSLEHHRQEVGHYQGHREHRHQEHQEDHRQEAHHHQQGQGRHRQQGQEHHHQQGQMVEEVMEEEVMVRHQ